MSNMQTCLCDRKHYRVEHRNHNHSYFESPKGGAHYSDYSGIRCVNCGHLFRSKAKWVRSCPGLSLEEIGKVRKGEYGLESPNVAYSVSIQSWGSRRKE